MTRPRILIVEDDGGLRQVIHIQLEREGYEISSVSSAEEGLAVLEKSPHHLVITDLGLPGMSGIDLLKRIRVEYPETAIILMTAFGTVQTAIEAMKAGAYDYITKPIHPFELKELVKRSLEHRRLLEEVQVLRSSLDRRSGFEEIIGSSPALLQSLDVAARMAATDATVLIYGETGTGKELVARAIHFRSTRRDHPFITINCGAIPRELLESELFGHVKGSFTGAFTHKKGKVEMADGGTVFLDEIGEMPLELQVRILRLIQEREIEKVGATTPTKVDVRIIAATHRDLAAMIKENTFREDLYYRLLVVPINLPPLRGRDGDIGELALHFFLKSRVKHGRPDLLLPHHILNHLSQYHWPGNVRQLENTIERLVLLAKRAEISEEDLPDFLLPTAAHVRETPVTLPEGEMDLAAIEKELILQALKKHNGNQTRAARYLKMSRRALGYRLEKYGLPGGVQNTLKNSAG
ncbi:MAG: sigma-54 dependent transcriptional regulator [Bryobacteraceae bacterium]|jgi:DNA-binding NtrC family response regulator